MRKNKQKKFSRLTLMCLPLLACGGNGGTSTKITVIDANGSGHVFKDAAGSAACTATADYGTVTLGSNQDEIKSTAAEVGSGAPNEEFDGLLNSDTAPDLAVLQLYAGYGGFGSGAVKTGTFPIMGDDLNYASCGICAEIQTNVDFNSMQIVDTYFATGGSITLTMVGSGSANSGTLAGSFTNVTFTHVTIGSDGTTTAVGDNCNSKIEAMSFSGVLAADTGSAAAFTGEPFKLNFPTLHHRWR